MADDGGSESNIEVMFVPFLARSHTLSLVGTARLFAQRRGVRCTVVTTPGNSSYIRGAIEHANRSEGLPIDLQLVPFPAAEVGLPAGVECTESLPPGFDNYIKLMRGLQLLQRPIEKLVVERRPDLIVADVFLYFLADQARSLSIPFLMFDPMSPFSKAVFESIFDRSGSALVTSSPGSDTVGPLTGLPHPLEFGRAELPPRVPFPMDKMLDAERRSCGTLFNSFEELTPEYVEYCREKARNSGGAFKFWCVGPVQLPNQDAGGDWEGSASAIKKWLDSKRPESVLYVSFGSECLFGAEQLREIAVGLRGCGHPFVWVVRGNGGGAETMDEWLPQGFREAVGDRGLILTEWAPQYEILSHRAAGAFVTHCGWRSTLEALCTGLPMIPWPLHSEQFINERLLVEILRVGVRILEGPEMRSMDAKGKGLVKGGLISDAVDRLLGGTDEEARAMREAAKRYKELAAAAMAKGGSSYANLSDAVEEMKMMAREKKQLVAE